MLLIYQLFCDITNLVSKPCHSERSEESLKILRFAQDDIKVLDLTKH